MAPPAFQVRLKPHDPKRGHVLNRLTLSVLDGKRYEQGHWYEANAAEADLLRRVNQQGQIAETVDDLQGIAAFDVMTREEAEELATAETRAALLSAPEVRNLMKAPTREDPGDAPVPAAAPVRRVGARNK